MTKARFGYAGAKLEQIEDERLSTFVGHGTNKPAAAPEPLHGTATRDA